MSKKQARQKSGILLMEFIIMLLIFFLLCAITLQLFSKSSILSQRSSDTSAAVLKAQSIAETIQADPTVPPGTRYYNDQWQESDAANARYRAVVRYDQQVPGYLSGSVVIYREDTELYSLPLAHYYKNREGGQ